MIDLNKIREDLVALPDMKRKQALIAVEKRKKMDEAKLRLDVAIGMALSTSNKANATEKKAFAVNQSEKEAEEHIKAKYKYEIANAEFNFVDDKFISTRKLASLEEKMMNSNISGF